MQDQSLSNVQIARRLSKTAGYPIHKDAVRRARKRWGLTGDGRTVTVTGDTAKLNDSNIEFDELNDPETLLRQRGLDPDEWNLDKVSVTEWGPDEQPFHRLRADLSRKRPSTGLLPARSDGWRPPKRARKARTGPRTVVIVGDQQAPFHDENLHRLFLEWLRDNQPDEGITLGDTVDFPDISRHPFDPDSNATVNECIQSGYDLLRGYVDASPDTQWTKLFGNHDERIRNYALNQARELYGIRRAQLPGEEEERSVLDVDFLLRLDELGIELVDPHGPYDQGQYNLGDKLAVRHGWLVKKRAGETAIASLEHLGYSIIVGHTHRQSLVHKTAHDINDKPVVLAAAEAGCMCVVQRQEINGRWWPNYAVAQNWQQGFATATIWDDGTFKIDLATYVKDMLLYRDQCYR